MTFVIMMLHAGICLVLCFLDITWAQSDAFIVLGHLVQKDGIPRTTFAFDRVDDHNHIRYNRLTDGFRLYSESNGGFGDKKHGFGEPAIIGKLYGNQKHHDSGYVRHHQHENYHHHGNHHERHHHYGNHYHHGPERHGFHDNHAHDYFGYLGHHHQGGFSHQHEGKGPPNVHDGSKHHRTFQMTSKHKEPRDHFSYAGLIHDSRGRHEPHHYIEIPHHGPKHHPHHKMPHLDLDHKKLQFHPHGHRLHNHHGHRKPRHQTHKKHSYPKNDNWGYGGNHWKDDHYSDHSSFGPKKFWLDWKSMEHFFKH